MPPVLFFPLRLPQLKLPRLLTLPLGTGLHPARSLALLARLGAKHDPAHRVLSVLLALAEPDPERRLK